MMITKAKPQKDGRLENKAGQFVSTEFVDTMRAEYKKERWMQNSARLGKPDSLSVWYDAEFLQTFLDACKKHGADGVRYYFSAYPHDFTEKEGYAGRQSLVMVATRSKTDEHGNITNKDVYISQNGQNIILGANMANPCPPICHQFGDNDLGMVIVDKGVKEGFEII